MPDRLDVPPLPNTFNRAMRIWQKLHRRRQTGMGLGNFTYPDLGFYVFLHGDPLSEGDMEALDIIEGEFRAAAAAAEDRRQKLAEKKAPKGKR